MDGWLVIEPPRDIRDLVLLIRYNAPAEEQRRAQAQGADPQGDRLRRRQGRPDQLARRARGATPSIPTTSPGASTSCSSTRTGNIRWPITATRRTASSRPSSTRRRTSPPSCYLKPGMKVLDIGCGWGGLALYLHRHYDVDVLGVALAPDQIEFSNERAAEAGRRRPGQVRADGLSRRRGPVRPDHQRRPDRASRHAALSGLLRPHPPPAQGRRRDVLALLRPDGRAGRHRQMDPQVHLPGRLYPGALRAGHRGGEEPADRHRRRGDALPLRPHARGMVQPDDGRTRRRSPRSTTSASSACGNSIWPAPRPRSAMAAWSTGSSNM